MGAGPSMQAGGAPAVMQNMVGGVMPPLPTGNYPGMIPTPAPHPMAAAAAAAAAAVSNPYAQYYNMMGVTAGAPFAPMPTMPPRPTGFAPQTTLPIQLPPTRPPLPRPQLPLAFPSAVAVTPPISMPPLPGSQPSDPTAITLSAAPTTSTAAAAAAATVVPPSKPLGSKTRIVVPDENISLVCFFATTIFKALSIFRKSTWLNELSFYIHATDSTSVSHCSYILLPRC